MILFSLPSCKFVSVNILLVYQIRTWIKLLILLSFGVLMKITTTLNIMFTMCVCVCVYVCARVCV